jgi:hypothetical protein
MPLALPSARRSSCPDRERHAPSPDGRDLEGDLDHEPTRPAFGHTASLAG